jgi:hypothetical protein
VSLLEKTFRVKEVIKVLLNVTVTGRDSTLKIAVLFPKLYLASERLGTGVETNSHVWAYGRKGRAVDAFND